MSSMLYTMGTALGRAQQGGLPVEVLVEGHWMRGRVAGMDGHGLVLDDEGRAHTVVSMDRIAAVRVSEPAPMRDHARTQTAGSSRGSGSGPIPLGTELRPAG
jgi:hypothetical protein